MANGGMHDDARGTVDRGTAERGVEGARLNDRATSRSTRPRGAAALPPAAPRISPADAPRLTRIETIGRWVERRNQFLSELTQLLRAGAPREFASRSLRRRQAQLKELELEFRDIMTRYQSNPRPLSAADRRAAIRILNDAYELSEGYGWSRARQEFWKGLYNSPRGRQLVERARQAGILQLRDDQMRSGGAPRILDFDDQGRARYVSVDIDHMVPRERNPFRAFQPDNLHLQTEQFNRRYLNDFSEATPFPMGRYGEPDDIEEFVQAHQLSRRQRPEAERPRRRRGRRSGRSRGAGAVGRIAILLGLLFAADRQRAYASVGEALRRAARARQEARRSPPIRPDDVDAFNVESKIESVYLIEGIHPRSPMEVDSTRADQLRLAVERWLQREYRPNGRGRLEFESRLAEARNRRDVDALNHLLNEVGHVRMRYLPGIVLGDLAQVPSSASHIEDARQLVLRLLENRETYLQAAEEASRLAQLQPEALEMEAQAYAISIDDLMTVYDHTLEIARSCRMYVNHLEFLLAALSEAAQANEDRFRRITAALEEAEAARSR